MYHLLQGISMLNFHAWATRPPKQTTTKTCHVLMVA
jgi:hypothetical protein